MPEYSEAFHRTIITVDVARFTAPARKGMHQVAVHGGLDDLLRTAFQDAGIAWHLCEVEDRGDGKLILVRPEVPKIRLAVRLWAELLTGLRRHNAVHSNESTIQLRVAFHAGEVWLSEAGKVSPAINFTSRLVEAPEAKAALEQSQALVALIASDEIYRDVIEPDPAAAPDMFRRIGVEVKETSAVAWLRLSESRPVTADHRPPLAPGDRPPPGWFPYRDR